MRIFSVLTTEEVYSSETLESVRYSKREWSFDTMLWPILDLFHWNPSIRRVKDQRRLEIWCIESDNVTGEFKTTIFRILREVWVHYLICDLFSDSEMQDINHNVMWKVHPLPFSEPSSRYRTADSLFVDAIQFLSLVNVPSQELILHSSTNDLQFYLDFILILAIPSHSAFTRSKPCCWCYRWISTMAHLAITVPNNSSMIHKPFIPGILWWTLVLRELFSVYSSPSLSSAC